MKHSLIKQPIEVNSASDATLSSSIDDDVNDVLNDDEMWEGGAGLYPILPCILAVSSMGKVG
jgi:hypothetical protein